MSYRSVTASILVGYSVSVASTSFVQVIAGSSYQFGVLFGNVDANWAGDSVTYTTRYLCL